MTVYIGHAVGDEHGKSKGGQPGDQTGTELRKSKWYLNDKGWRVFRAIDAAVRKKIAYAMQAAVDNPNIGYDQSTRNSLYDLAAKVGFDPARVDEPCNTDCSALVRVCCAYAGIKLASFNTTSEPDRLLKSGAFSELIGTQYTTSPDYLMAGDILVTKVKGHTAIVLNNGPKANDDPLPHHTPDAEPVGDEYVEVIGARVNVRVGDNAQSAPLFVARRGGQFAYLGTAPSGWYRINTDLGTGYISNRTDLTKLHGDPAPEQRLTSESYVLVIGGSVHVRNKADASGASIGIAHRGNKLPYLGTADTGWYNVTFAGQTGYISNKPTLTKLEEA